MQRLHNVTVGSFPLKTALGTCGTPNAERSKKPIISGWKFFNTNNSEIGVSMLYTLAVILLILWVLGLVTSYTLGGFIHILLVVAVVMILLNLISGGRSSI
jgi:predicted ferric reductase